MIAVKPVGRGAASRKYDLITALGTLALAQGKSDQRRALRLITLITARYNWSRDELAVGQAEIARLWSCDPRTVKREMAQLRANGWLVLKRQGVRGRVAQYGLGIEAIFDASRPGWDRVGPDFAHRMRGDSDEAAAPDPKVVAFPSGGTAPPDLSDGSEWSLAQALIYQDHPGAYAAWLRALTREGRAGGRLTLRAPSRFHARYVQTHLIGLMTRAIEAVSDEVREVVITHG
ncbi:hypothetical protein [Poseidonocella sedimentorum]|uniref:DnaA N-terminal domain-containing protein n=1 Tax=Poseidonocella sedimentorum TaxID=871652 RepID=A0A1I6EEA0_9RHOB|nr:hypothetical protein [Poseidonocella sedimentorum]SFR15842.1 hypothetical protein SAMN04515673_11062 [Poseidonocella sedimentorum]